VEVLRVESLLREELHAELADVHLVSHRYGMASTIRCNQCQHIQSRLNTHEQSGPVSSSLLTSGGTGRVVPSKSWHRPCSIQDKDGRWMSLNSNSHRRQQHYLLKLRECGVVILGVRLETVQVRS